MELTYECLTFSMVLHATHNSLSMQIGCGFNHFSQVNVSHDETVDTNWNCFYTIIHYVLAWHEASLEGEVWRGGGRRDSDIQVNIWVLVGIHVSGGVASTMSWFYRVWIYLVIWWPRWLSGGVFAPLWQNKEPVAMVAPKVNTCTICESHVK